MTATDPSARKRAQRARLRPYTSDPQDTSWRERAACRDVDPDVFFPTDKAEERAVALCGDCTEREPCLDYAVTTRQFQGVWGGRTEAERLAMRPRRRRK